METDLFFVEIGKNGGDKESIKKMLLIEEVCVHLPVIRLYYPYLSTYPELPQIRTF